MYKYLSIALLLAIFVVGCTDKSNMIAPIGTDNNNIENKAIENPNWIVLPANEDQSIKKVVTVGKTIYGTDESLLEINTGYAAPAPYSWVSITANARFQRYSFTGSRYVTMSVDADYGSASFTPSGTWLKPVIFNLTIVGVDLSNINPATVKFVYMAPDGKYYPAQYERIYVDKSAGKLQVVNAQLPHFSRWGFIN